MAVCTNTSDNIFRVSFALPVHVYVFRGVMSTVRRSSQYAAKLKLMSESRPPAAWIASQAESTQWQSKFAEDGYLVSPNDHHAFKCMRAETLLQVYWYFKVHFEIQRR